MPTGEQKNENAAAEIAAAEIAVKHNPASLEPYMELGLAYFHAEQLDEALDVFQQASALNPNAAGVFNWIGRVYERLGPVEAAVEAFEHAIALDQQSIAPYVGLGIVYFDQLHDYEAAIEAFQTGLEHTPDDAFAAALLGVTYARMGRFDEAITSLQQAISRQPDNTFAYSNLSIVYFHLKRYDEMIAACQREIEIADGHDARRLLGFVYERLGRFDEAVYQLERAIALDPQDYESRGALAKVYGIVDRQQEADEQYAIASQLAGQDNEYDQACFEAVTGNLEGAIKLLEVALTKGQVEPGWARIDPEFAFISDDPRFRAFIGN